MNASNKILVRTLRYQSEEIVREGIAGWGNTMSDAADAIEAQDMDNDFLDKQLAALRARVAELEAEQALDYVEKINKYYDGVKDGVYLYAWWADGGLQVGTSGKTFTEAWKEIEQDRAAALAKGER